jgi:Putative gypsy type transposon
VRSYRDTLDPRFKEAEGDPGQGPSNQADVTVAFGNPGQSSSVPAEVPMAVRIQPLHHGEAGRTYVDQVWATKFMYASGPALMEDHYNFGADYKVTTPGEKDTICCPPVGHIGIYLKDLEYGLRFPLHPRVQAILEAMGVAIGQLMPLAIRTIVGFVWICLWKQEAPTVNLFRRLHCLQKVKGWYALMTEANYVTVNPKLTSSKNWKDRFVFVGVPDDFPLPRTFEHRVNLRCEGPAERSRLAPGQTKMSASSVRLNADERRLFEYFRAIQGTRSKKCENWLPPMQIICQDEPLGLLGLIPSLSQGKWGRYGAPLSCNFRILPCYFAYRKFL